MEPRLTLPAVRDTISKESLRNPTWKGLLYFARDIAVYAAILVGLYSTDAWYFLVPLWILAGLAVSGLFIIGHDAAHGALFKNQKLAYLIGQISMLPSLHAYHQWVYGHNRIHHGHTIKMEGDFVWRPTSPAQYRNLSWAGKIWHRITWSAIGSGIYYLVQIWFGGMILFVAQTKGAKRDRILIILAAIAMIAVPIALFPTWQAGLWVAVKLGVIPFLAFNYCIGFSVYVHHIHDFIPWKKHKDWTPFYGQMLGTVNYHIPAFFNFFLHNIFLHMPHHVNMRVPFYNLGRALSEIKSVYGQYVIERKSMFMDYLHTTRKCKLFDPESGKWLTYAEAAEERTPNLSQSVPA
ncbi:MAG TPA: fatty acid desaturase [Leptospiraceae bacterium]|nr:fatty acid desaturase [Leptospiraceae bacterium]